MGRKDWSRSLEAVVDNPVTYLETLTSIRNRYAKLWPKQKAFLLDPSDFRIILKARQSGFSKTIAGEALWAAHTQPLGYPEVIVFVSTSERQAKWLLSARFYTFYDSLRLKRKPKLTTRAKTECVFKNGSIVTSLPNNPETVRGYTATRIYIDEYGHFKNDEKIKFALEPSISHGGKVILSSTPSGKIGCFYDTWRGSVKNKNPYTRHKCMWTDVPAYMKTYHKRVKHYQRTWPKTYFNQEYCCMFVEEGSSPFPSRLISSCINPESSNLREMLNNEHYTTLGMDIGKKHSKTVIIVVEHIPLPPQERIAGDHDPYKRVVRHVSSPDHPKLKTQLDELDEIIARYKPHEINVDETAMGEMVGEELYDKYGERYQGVQFTQPSKYNMVLETIRLFETHKIELPNHPLLTGQLLSMRREIMPKSGMIRYRGDEDDYVWALCLATSAQRATEPLVAVMDDEDFEIFDSDSELWIEGEGD